MNTRLLIVLALLTQLLPHASPLRGQVYEKVFSFTDARITDRANSPNKGGLVRGSVMLGSDGNFYGTTSSGGANGYGTVFKMTPTGALTTLVEFTGNGAMNKGSGPFAGLVQGSDGNLYGTTEGGGASYCGTVFKVTPAGVLKTLVEFTGNGVTNKGTSPRAGLILGNDGNFYGTTQRGGASDYGTVFKVTPTGVLTTLVEFTSNGATNKGSYPGAGLLLGNDGNFYGTTNEGGANGNGTVFKMTPAGVLTTLVEFTGNGVTNKGSYPGAGLLLGSDGNFYGMTGTGGANDYGTVFKMTPAGGLTTLVEFTGNGATNKGRYPGTGLLLGSDGNFYGTTSSGGANGYGTVFKMTPTGALTTLVEFTGNGAMNKGGGPFAGLVRGRDGNFYGTTYFGGANDYGTVFKMTPAGVLTTLVEFTYQGATNEGANPRAGLVQGSDGNFYGTTSGDHLIEHGTVFRLTPTGGLTTLVEFTGNGVANKGSFPVAALVQGSDGNFYGTTKYGGANDHGTVFKMTSAGELTTLIDFTGNGAANKGSFPVAALVQGSDGNFYGTTSEGGSNGIGTVFKLTPEGVLTTLVDFTGNGVINKGSYPRAGLVLGDDGNFYGTTEYGGAGNCGTVFKLTPAGGLTTLVEFTGNGATNKGSGPAVLVKGRDGYLYGTTQGGGRYGCGTAFRTTLTGVLSTFLDFTDTLGVNKCRYLSQGSDGNFYGATNSGGSFGYGTAFKMTPLGVLTTLMEFSEDGYPEAGLLPAADGNLYGTTSGRPDQVGGPDGTIYRIVLPGAPTVLSNSIQVTGSSEAVLDAIVNARGSSTTTALEYGTDGTNFPNTVAVATDLKGFQTRLIGTTLSGLTAGSTYFFRFRAQSSAGTTVSSIQSFSTLAAPVATIDPASDITPTSARFNGTVNARNFDSTVVFEWGNDGFNFPNLVPAVPGTVTGNSAVAVSADVVVPQGSTVYFRIRASNAGGTVTTGARGFNTGLGVNTSALGSADIGVTDVLFKATVNTFGQAASVKFKYWADSAPGVIFETATQTVTTNGPQEVSARVTGLLENVAYSYRVSVELAGTETDGGAVMFTTDTNQAPVAASDLVFYSGQVVIDPLANDTDPNDGTNANLLLAPALVVAPDASLGVASVTSDRRFISYNPQFNVLDDDALTYRVVDPLGASADAQVRLIAFSKRAGLYGGKITFGSGVSAREGQVAVQMGSGGAISTSFMAWPSAGVGERESFVLKGVFDQRGRFTRTLNSPGGAVLTLTLQLDADAPRMLGTFEERVDDVSTTGVINFILTKNAGTGGLAESGLRTGFLSPPPVQAGVMVDGFLRMTVGKDARRGARFAGRLPDGEPFLASARAEGRTYTLVRALEQGGLFTGLVRAIDAGAGGSESAARAAGMMGDLFWQKRASSRARYHRSGVETVLSLSGVAYPVVARGELPPLGLGLASPNARLRFSGGDLGGTYRDLLLNVLPGSVTIIGPDPAQSGADVSLEKLRVVVDGPSAKFTGRFIHPQTQKLVPFEGALRAPFDGQPAHGRGVFRGPSAAGAVTIQAE